MSGSVRKAVYVDEEAAEWVEQAAEQSDRSESYVIAELIRVAIRASDEPPESISQYADELGDRLVDA